MPTSKQTPNAKPARGARGISALDGLEVSLEDAQKALAELRHDLSAGGRRVVAELERAVKNTRRDLIRTRKAIQSDLSDLGGALTPRSAAKAPARKPAAKKAAAKSPAKKPAAKAKPRATGSRVP